VQNTAIGLSVCLSVHTYQTPRPNFTNFLYLLHLLWLDLPSLCNTFWCFRYCGWRIFHIKEWTGQNQRRRVRFVQFARWRNLGEVCRIRLHVAHFEINSFFELTTAAVPVWNLLTIHAVNGNGRRIFGHGPTTKTCHIHWPGHHRSLIVQYSLLRGKRNCFTATNVLKRKIQIAADQRRTATDATWYKYNVVVHHCCDGWPWVKSRPEFKTVNK